MKYRHVNERDFRKDLNPENYKFILDGSVFNYKNKYENDIQVEEMTSEDIKIFKKIIGEISTEMNIVINPLFSIKYGYWYAGMFTDKLYDIVSLMNKKGMIYE